MKTHTKILSIALLVVLQIAACNTAFAAVTKKEASNGGLVGYWSFDEGKGTKAADHSGNGNAGSLNGGVSWVSGRHGKALQFDGSSGYVSVPNSTSLNISNAFSVAAWVNFSDSSNRGIIEKTVGGAVNTQFLLFTESNSFKFRVMKSAGYQTITSDGTAAANKWYFVAGTYDGSVMKMYVNGVLQSQTLTVAAPIDSGSGQTYIGQLGGGIYRMSGIIDDARIYNRALAQSEISKMYQSGAVQENSDQDGKAAGGLVGFWPSDGLDVSGSVLYDRSGNSRNLSLFGPAAAPGRVQQSLHFNGTSQYASSSAVFSELGTNNQPYTVTAWVKLDAGKTGGDIIHAASLANGTGWCLAPLKIDNLKAETTSWSSGNVTVTGSTSLKTNTWYFLSASWSSGGGLRVYVNGVLDGSASQATFTGSGVPDYLFLGGAPGATGCTGDMGYFGGSIDEPRIYNRQLSVSELLALYASDKKTENVSENSKNTGGLVSYWSFNGKDTTAVSATDVAGGGNNAGFAGGVSRAPGKVGQALKFDGSSGSYISVADNANLVFTNKITISAWVKPSSAGNTAGAPILCKGNGGGGEIYCLDFPTANNLTPRFYFWTGGNAYTVVAGSAVPVNRWSFITATYDGSTLAIYVNGILSSTSAFSGSLASNNHALTMGCRQSGSAIYDMCFNGFLDEVRLYNKVLSAADIAKLYALGK